jgi:hypothetical protein
VDVHFCDPRNPWQRGSNGSTNRLLSQYLAERADLRQFSIRPLNDLAERINTDPVGSSTRTTHRNCSGPTCERNTFRKRSGSPYERLGRPRVCATMSRNIDVLVSRYSTRATSTRVFSTEVTVEVPMNLVGCVSAAPRSPSG